MEGMVRSSVLGEDVVRGKRGEKIPTGTRFRLWNAKRMLSSGKTSLSTVGFQGPLRKVFTPFPPSGCLSAGLKTGKGAARPASCTG